MPTDEQRIYAMFSPAEVKRWHEMFRESPPVTRDREPPQWRKPGTRPTGFRRYEPRFARGKVTV